MARKKCNALTFVTVIDGRNDGGGGERKLQWTMIMLRGWNAGCGDARLVTRTSHSEGDVSEPRTGLLRQTIDGTAEF